MGRAREDQPDGHERKGDEKVHSWLMMFKGWSHCVILLTAEPRSIISPISFRCLSLMPLCLPRSTASEYYNAEAAQPRFNHLTPCFAPFTDLETLMRATLGALANFNEDEKMIITKSVPFRFLAATDALQGTT